MTRERFWYVALTADGELGLWHWDDKPDNTATAENALVDRNTRFLGLPPYTKVWRLDTEKRQLARYVPPTPPPGGTWVTV